MALGFRVDVLLVGPFSGAGIGDQCGNDGIASFTDELAEWSGSKGYCM